MSTFYPPVMAQFHFACAVLAFIRKFLQAIFPEIALDTDILGTDDQFKNQTDAALAALDPNEANEYDYRRAVAGAACREVADLCELLSEACRCSGFGKLASRYFTTRRFLLLVLKQDAAMLAALNAVMDSGDRNLGRLLVRVGETLDSRPGTYSQMDAAAKRKATGDAKMIIAKVEEIHRSMDEQIEAVGEKVDSVGGKIDVIGAKVDGLKPRTRRKGKYSEAERNVCRTCWETAQRNAEVRYASNKGVTYENAFTYFKRELAKVGVTTVKRFKAVLRTIQSRECEDRKRELEAKREAERKRKTRKR